MKKIVAIMFLGIFLFGTPVIFAQEPTTTVKKHPMKQVMNVEGRGIVNVLTTPWELVRTFNSERALHPKAWIVSYPPRFLLNAVIRLTSGINDMLVMPWIVNPSEDPRPITRRFDLPDYPWQKE